MGAQKPASGLSAADFVTCQRLHVLRNDLHKELALVR